ncbi:UNVERIFIED_CONTAM: hypothetical protein GTU68_002058 [Idotea baltica]|nr:hypothetical protein [Idotea baltica]
MLDHYVYGNMNRISPEAPMPIVDVEYKENRLGGAGNVASNIHYMGATSILVSVVGNDAAAQNLLSEMKSHEMNTSGIILDLDRKTTVKTRVFCQNRQVARYDEEMREPLSSKLEISLINLIEELIEDNQPSVIVLQDYNKGVLTPTVIAAIIELAEKYGIPTAVDPKVKNFNLYQKCTLFKPNLKEISKALNQPILPQNESMLVKAAATIEQELGNIYTVITLSEHGMFLKAGDSHELSPVVKGHKVYDVCGAGDTVIAVLAIGLALGKNMFNFMSIANIAAAQVCQEVGVVHLDLKRVYEQVSGIEETLKF